MHLFPAIPNIVTRALVCLLVSLGSFGCSTVLEHPSYKSKLATARTDCRGDEIVGMWVSRGTFPIEGTYLVTTQIRPGGTGLTRIENSSYGPAATSEWDQTWRYAGHGAWKGTQQLRSTSNPMAAAGKNFQNTWRYTGRELLSESVYAGPMGPRTVRRVLVRAGDTRAVESHLRSN